MEEGWVKVKGESKLEDLRAGCQGSESESNEPVQRGWGKAVGPHHCPSASSPVSTPGPDHSALL